MPADDAALWDDYADTFDDDPDHGLTDPEVRAAWSDLMLGLLPPAPASIADLGCGTGTLSVLLASHGYAVTGLDISERMLHLARAKAVSASAEVTFIQGDAGSPALEPGAFDVVLARHVLWVFEDADAVLDRWLALLRPGGRLVLVEGRWSTGAGLTAEECERLVRRHRASGDVVNLSDRDALWGGPVTDERYALISRA
jgi:SAM-dependent methyltransferase